MLTMQAVIAAVMFPWSFKTLTSQAGLASRIMGLIDHLGEMKEKKAVKSTSQFIRSEATIEFKNVNIETPSGNALVDNLSFTLGLKDSLLITGHNGAGKSLFSGALAAYGTFLVVLSRSQEEILKDYCLVFFMYRETIPSTWHIGRPIDISGLCEWRNIDTRDIKEHFGASRSRIPG